MPPIRGVVNLRCGVFHEIVDGRIGDSYVLGTQTLTASGTYTETFTANTGCDSIVTLNLTVLPNLTEILDAEICVGDSYVLGTQTQGFVPSLPFY